MRARTVPAHLWYARHATGARLRQCLVDPAIERAEVARARAPRHFLAAAEQDERRDAADAEATGELLVLVGVHLAYLQLRTSLGGEAVEHRRHGTTRAAPLRPEIHEHRQVAAPGMRFESLRVERNRLARDNCGLAFRAGGVVSQSILRDAD